MSITQIAITLAYLQFVESKTTTSVSSSDNNYVQIDSQFWANFTMNGTEIEDTLNSIMKEHVYTKESDNRLMNKKAIRADLGNYPEDIDGKNRASMNGKSLASESDDKNSILILIILLVFIVTLISVVSFTVYSRNSRISIELNSDVSKNEKKLRYSEVATEEQPVSMPCTDNSWRNTMASKITSITRALKSIGDLSTLRNTIPVQKSRTPSTHTLSSASHHSIEMESCIDPPNELIEKNAGTGTGVSRTQTCTKKTFSVATNKAQDENLDTAKRICPKCNHCRDPKMVVKRINEVERRGGRIHIPIQLPVVVGSNKIKSVEFHKSVDNQSSTTPSQKKCHRGSCCHGIKCNRGSSSSSTSRQKEAAVSCSSTGKSKLNDDCPSTSSSNHSQREKPQSSAASCSSTGKSKGNLDAISSSSSDYSRKKDDEQSNSVFNSSTGISEKNYDCFKSKSVISDQEIYSESSTAECSTPPKRKSKSSPRSNPSISNLSTSSRCMNSEYESSHPTLSSESQTEDFMKTSSASSACTSKNTSSVYDVSDGTSSQSSSSYEVAKFAICENHYDEECQSVPSTERYTNSSAARTVKSLPSTIGSCLSSTNQSCISNSSETQSQSHGESNSTKSQPKSIKVTNENPNQSSVCSNLAYKAPVKFKVLSTDPNFNPSTLQVKQQLKILLNDELNSKNPVSESSKDEIRLGQVIYADLCFVPKQSAAGCANKNPCLISLANKDSGISTQSVSCAVSRKHSNVTSESESDPGYGASQPESTESEDPNGYPYGKNHSCCSADESNNETDSYYCASKICCDDFPRSNFSKKFSSGWGRRTSADTTLSEDSKGSLIQSLNQRLKGTYMRQTTGSSRSRFASSSRCAPVLEYTVDDGDYDVYEPVEEQSGTGGRYMRNSMNKLLPKIRSYMSRRKKSSVSSVSTSEEMYEEPSNHEGTAELCENCMKHVPNDITKTIRSRQSLYSNADKFKRGGTIHLNDLIEMYPNLYPKLPTPIREALSKGFDEVSVSPYGNLCDNYERVQERKWSELSASFENINYTD